MKDWEKRRDVLADNETAFCRCAGFTCSGCESKTKELYSKGFTAGRTDTLAELGFVRETLIKISKDRCVHVSGEATNIPTWSADEASKALSRLDALTGDGEK